MSDDAPRTPFASGTIEARVMMIRVPAEGVELAAYPVETAGSAAPWLILSNSLGADHGMWDGEIAFLSRGYRVLRYDTRGHGASTSAPEPCTIEELGRDVLALMDHFGIGAATLLGLSLGGMTGLSLALDHPRRITRLVCCDARSDMPEVGRRGWDERIAAVKAGGVEAVLAATVERWLMPHTRETRPDIVERVHAMFRATTAEGYIGCGRAIQALDLLRRLPRLTVPVLYVVGEADTGAPPEAMRAMAEATPGAVLKIVPASAHVANLDNPEAFAAAIGPFLRL